MNFIDIIVLVVILLAGINGFRKGIINSVVLFVGSLIVFILAFYLKNPVSIILYKYLPFFNLSGKFAGITVFNILIYEGISYLITISLLGIIFKIVTKVTGMVSGVINSTIVLGFPSKILGAIIGLLEGYVVAFILLFIFGLMSGTATKVNNSKFGNPILENTPVLSGIVGDTYNSIKEVYDVCLLYENVKDKDTGNLESLDILLKYEILNVKSADELITVKKITTPGANEVVNKYRKETIKWNI